MTGFVQQSLSLSRHLLLFALVLAAWPFLRERPDFRAFPDGMVEATFSPVAQASPRGWTLHGAWAIEAHDPRVAGFSAIVCRGARGHEIATDLGSLITFRAPAAKKAAVTLAVRGHEDFKEGEALLLRGETRIIAQENWDELLILNPDETSARRTLSGRSLQPNRGIEALLDLRDEEQSVLAFHEGGRLAYRVTDSDVMPVAVEGATMAITDAAWHPDGRAFILQRSVGPTGFRAGLAEARWSGSRVTVGPTLALPLPFNANAEGLCIEPRGAGSARLWIVTDDNGLSVLAQRLVAWNVPDDAWPPAPEGARD